MIRAHHSTVLGLEEVREYTTVEYFSFNANKYLLNNEIKSSHPHGLNDIRTGKKAR